MDIERARPFGNIIKDVYVFHRFSSIIEAAGSDASITKAAHKLGLSSTGLLQCLKRLEEEYGASLIDAHQRTTGVRITNAGRIVLEESAAIFAIHNDVKAKVYAASGHGNMTETINIASSPYLLAHVFPEAVSGYLQALESAAKCRIECEEGYYTKQIIKKIESGDVDFAVVWNYPEKVEQVRTSSKDVTCAIATRRIDPVIVFGKEHEEFRKLLEEGTQGIFIEDLALETLFVLEADHQPLRAHIPDPILHEGGKHIQFSTFASIIGSIRAGMRASAILPGIFADLDKYRRDGSLYFLPLKSRHPDKDLSIEILYIFKGTRPKTWGKGKDGIRYFKDMSTVLIKNEARKFLDYIEDKVLPELLERSGWWPDAAKGGMTRQRPGRVGESLNNITDYTFVYHISPDRVGLDEPRWHKSTIVWDSQGRTTSDQVSGVMTLCKTNNDECREYQIRAEMVGKQVLCLKGDRVIDGARTNVDSWVANFNYISDNRDYLIGVLSGRDDRGISDITCTCIMSKRGPGAISGLVRELHVARNHTMLEEEVKSFDVK